MKTSDGVKEDYDIKWAPHLKIQETNNGANTNLKYDTFTNNYFPVGTMSLVYNTNNIAGPSLHMFSVILVRTTQGSFYAFVYDLGTASP